MTNSRSRNGDAVHDGLFFQVSSDVARGRYLMEVYVRFYAFPQVDPRLGAAFLRIPDFKTRAKTQTNQSLARSIPSLSVGCTKALQQRIIDSRPLGLVLIFHLPHQSYAPASLATSRLCGRAWRAFQRTPRTVLPATPQLLPPLPRSLLFAFAFGLALAPNASSSQPGLLHWPSARSSLADAYRAIAFALVSCPRPDTFWTLARDT